MSSADITFCFMRINVAEVVADDREGGREIEIELLASRSALFPAWLNIPWLWVSQFHVSFSARIIRSFIISSPSSSSSTWLLSHERDKSMVHIRLKRERGHHITHLSSKVVMIKDCNLFLLFLIELYWSEKGKDRRQERRRRRSRGERNHFCLWTNSKEEFTFFNVWAWKAGQDECHQNQGMKEDCTVFSQMWGKIGFTASLFSTQSCLLMPIVSSFVPYLDLSYLVMSCHVVQLDSLTVYSYWCLWKPLLLLQDKTDTVDIKHTE